MNKTKKASALPNNPFESYKQRLLKTAKEAGITKVIIHAFTDGRDAPPKDNYIYLQELEKVLADLNIGYIATATGRYFAIDRDKNWDRT